MNVKALSIAILMFIVKASLANVREDARVKGNVNISTRTGMMHVSMSYRMLHQDSATSALRFHLTRDAVLKKVSGKDVKDFRFDSTTRPWSVAIDLNRQLKKDEAAELFFEYELPMDTAAYRKYGYIELGLDWFWFPVHPKSSEWKFIYNLDVRHDDPTLQLFSNGNVTGAGTSYNVRSIHPDFDIDLFLFRDARIYTDKNNTVRVVGNAANPAMKDSLVNVTIQYLELFRQLFGTNSVKVTSIFRPEPTGPNSFGYSRLGYFVLPDASSLSQIKFHVAHEVAHFWWLTGERTENAWITESFAEFSALLAMKRLDGDSAYNTIVRDKYQRIERMQKAGTVLQPVYGAGSKNKNRFSSVTLYHKGPLILHELYQKIGDEKMLPLLREAADKKIATTEQFLDMLGRYASQEVVAYTKNRLQTF